MVNVKNIGNNLVKNTNSLMKNIYPKPLYKVSHKYMYISFIILLFIILFIIWYLTRKEGLETKTDGSGCLVTDKNANDVDVSFNVSIPCKDFKDVLMGSTLEEYSSLVI